MATPIENTAAPSVEVPRLVRLLVDADSLMCVLDNITRGYRKHEPDDPDCWCNGCVNPRAVSWMESFREIRSEMEANDQGI